MERHHRRGCGTDTLQVTATAADENFEINANGAAFRYVRTNQTLFTIDAAAVEKPPSMRAMGRTMFKAADLSGTVLNTITLNGKGAWRSLIVNGSSAADTFVIDNGLAPRLRVQRTIPATLTFDIATVETLTLKAAGGTDTILIGDLAGVTGCRPSRSTAMQMLTLSRSVAVLPTRVSD